MLDAMQSMHAMHGMIANDVIDPALHHQHDQYAHNHVPHPYRCAQNANHARAAEAAARRASIIGSNSLQSIISATLPYEVGAAAGLLSKVRMGLTPSTAKVRERGSTNMNGGRRLGSATSAAKHKSSSAPGGHRLQAAILRSMPWDIVLRLMRKYLTTIQPDNPFLVAATVEQQFQNVCHTLQQTQATQMQGQSPESVAALQSLAPSHDFLVVYLVLAISVTLGSAHEDGYEERCAALSISLFEEGIQHLYGLPVFPSELAWLQTILLVLLYATVFPRAANVWVLSGVAVRSCLELGLHREQPHADAIASSHPGEDGLAPDEEADLRRRVFWAAYCLDRSICSVMQRPLSTPDTAIDTRLPLSHTGKNDPFLGTIAFNKMLSEILHVHFQNEPLPPPATSWDGWLANMENRIQTWHSSSSSSTSSSTSNDFMMARGLMVLHRPSPRVPLPSPSSLLRAFEAASAAERIHRGHLKHGVFRRPWLSAHYTLEAATVVLFCLRHGYTAIAERFTPTQIFDRSKQMTANLLAIAAHGWPEVGIYAGVYERLLGPLLERVFLRSPTLDTGRFGPPEDAELMRLLYPGPAHLDSLRYGLRQKQPQPSPSQELSPFDFNLFLLEDEIWEQAAMLEKGAIGGGADDWIALQDMDFGMA